MSKIFSESSEHLPFGKIENLSDWLTNETFYLQEDIIRKCEILNERQAAIKAHENMLFKIDEAVKIVKSAIDTVERELELMESDFQVMEDLVETLQSVQGTGICNLTPKPKTERENFMRSLYETDESILHLQTVLSEVEEAMRQGCEQPLAPLVTLVNILKCHQETLSSAEEKVDLILDKLLEISRKCPT